MNTAGGIGGNELDDEFGDFPLPISSTPRASGSHSHPHGSTHLLHPQQRNSSGSVTIPLSVEHNVVLHSDPTEPLISQTKTRLDSNFSLNQDNRNQLNRKANSLMTVYEQSSNNDTNINECSTSKSDVGKRLKSPSSISDLTYQRRTELPLIDVVVVDGQQTVKSEHGLD